ncbi:MAG: electron transfer flavoprotein subunit alpha/FixB family protein, partial [Erysipelotrichaceae bacterium]|nr:electron transfer flavoprotein subunit alpha/FixB family protein [Erysipelotrichaceae bacterium]
MEYNSAKIEDFHDIWVFCEQRSGKLMETDFELVSEGRKLADERKAQLVGVLLGENVKELAKEIGGYGADKVYVIEDPALKEYSSETYADALCQIVMDKKPEVLLIGASTIGRDLAPRCAARLHTGL